MSFSRIDRLSLDTELDTETRLANEIQIRFPYAIAVHDGDDISQQGQPTVIAPVRDFLQQKNLPFSIHIHFFRSVSYLVGKGREQARGCDGLLGSKQREDMTRLVGLALSVEEVL